MHGYNVPKRGEPMKNNKAVVLDLDGTLLTSAKTISYDFEVSEPQFGALGRIHYSNELLGFRPKS